MRTLALAALLAAVPAAASAASTGACHCYRDRTFDAARPQAVDPYLLATARSSLLSAAFGAPKRELVEAVMTGSDPDDLWVASWAGARIGRPAEALLGSRRELGSWKAALARTEPDLGPAFASRLGAGASAAELAALAADDVLQSRFGLEPATLRALRGAGATTSEVVLAAILVPSLGQPAPASWGWSARMAGRGASSSMARASCRRTWTRWSGPASGDPAAVTRPIGAMTRGGRRGSRLGGAHASPRPVRGSRHMRALWTTRTGGPEVLEVRDGPDPLPRAGEVRVRVRAAGLNFADIMARLGLYPDAPKPPAVLGYEVAGVVDAVGQGVSAPTVGTRVLALTRFGGQAELVCVAARQAVPMPEGMSFEVGAALPVNYLTAYHALFRVAALRPRERVLVHMAAGGVGLAAIQLCRTVEGVEVFGTASASKHPALRDQGCAHPIDYRTLDYEEEVRRLTGGRGVDVVLDPLGGKDWRKGYRLLRPAGRLIAYGFANLATGEKRDYLRLAREAVQIPIFTPVGLMNDNRAIAGVNVGHLWGELDLLGEELEALVALYGRGAIRPHVDATFPFARAADAHRHIQSRRNVGKVVLVP